MAVQQPQWGIYKTALHHVFNNRIRGACSLKLASPCSYWGAFSLSPSLSLHSRALGVNKAQRRPPAGHGEESEENWGPGRKLDPELARRENPWCLVTGGIQGQWWSLVKQEITVRSASGICCSTDINKWTLYLGRETQMTSNANPNANEVSVGVQSITIHPNYNSTLYSNDISLMKLNQPVTSTNYIRPICLASNASVFHNATSCWATGWGRIGKDEALPAPQTLQEVKVPVVGNRQCTCQYKPTEGDIITTQMICAGEAGKGACLGDSGGPLQCKQGSVWVQAGILSFGLPCATVGFPEVYSRVSEFHTWVIENVRGAEIGFVTYLSSGTDTDTNFKCNATVSNREIRTASRRTTPWADDEADRTHSHPVTVPGHLARASHTDTVAKAYTCNKRSFHPYGKIPCYSHITV
ncbi:Mastin [Triplophysa tibetana]|uniref:Mastin n=1 Tax=Triplophysa tibetana TaxID=1572043 RepID=A0A5A9PYA6_9TELE|nr:Mastin [Triplophysa tibetana]